MSVLLETSVGDIVVDLLTEFAPRSCEKWVAPNPRLQAYFDIHCEVTELRD